LPVQLDGSRVLEDCHRKYYLKIYV